MYYVHTVVVFDIAGQVERIDRVCEDYGDATDRQKNLNDELDEGYACVYSGRMIMSSKRAAEAANEKKDTEQVSKCSCKCNEGCVR